MWRIKYETRTGNKTIDFTDEQVKGGEFPSLFRNKTNMEVYNIVQLERLPDIKTNVFDAVQRGE